MVLLLLLLAQDPPPAAPANLRDLMAAAADKQREAASVQTKALGLHQGDQPRGFFSTPWPRSGPPLTPGPAPTAQPAAYTTSAAPWACEPLETGELNQLVSQAAQREQLSADLLHAVIRQESAGYPCAVSSKGAAGLMQLMPSTARQFSVTDPLNPRQNVEAGARLLKQLIERYPGDLASALAAYNAGTVPVDRHGGVPPYAETQNYVQQIMGWLTGSASEQ